ncbi:MAG TPA: hypothetical protein VEZ40_15445 [Pyrinomonadaceae bacterium]|nr:hypothetical protein [Pyrinomonadaceae bacterium]
MGHRKALPIHVVCYAILLCGCMSPNSPTTPKGLIGNFDLRPHLPADVQARAPKDDNATEYRAQVDVGEPAAKVLIRWRVFKDGQNAYILSASFELLEAVKGVELKANVNERAIDIQSGEADVTSHGVVLTWRNASSLTSKNGTIVATGEWRAT